MKLPLLVLSLAVPFLLTRVAFAQETNVHVRYQNTLLARALSVDDKDFCVRKVGERSDANAGLYDQCRVTRQFVADLLKLKASEKPQGFPPMTELKFTHGSEYKMVSDAMP